jgi:Cu/Ag efflux pump CusA
MVPFSAFASGNWTFGSPRLERYNGSAAVEIQGAPASGVSSGDAMNEIDAMVSKLPQGFGHEWTGLSAQERLSGSQAIQLYAISILVVFLALAALYESWSIPLAVMLSVPIGIFGALLAATLFGQSNDVYFKVGLLTTIGLAAKNAILIVEFAIEQQKHGKDLVERDIGGIAPAATADPDDVAGLHPRCASAGDRQWRRLRQPELDRHRRHGRHDRRHGSRRFLHTAALRRRTAHLQRQ